MKRILDCYPLQAPLRTERSMLSVLCCFMVFGLLIAMPNHEVYGQKKKNKNKGSKTTNANSGGAKASKLSLQDDQRVQQLLFDGILATSKDNTEAAEAAYKQCLKIDPNNDGAMYQLAQLYFKGNEKEQALNYARDAASIDPNNKWYQFLYAEVLAVNGRYDQSAKVYEQLVGKYPNNYDYYFDLSYMYLQAGNVDAAIKAYDRLEERTGVMEEVSLRKQRLYIQTNKPDKAIAEMSKLVDSDPRNPRHYQRLAEMYEANGNMKEAQATYLKMVEIDPDNPYARLAMAEYKRSQGDSDAYFKELEAAFAIPDLPFHNKTKAISKNLATFETNKEIQPKIISLLKQLTEVHPKEALGHSLYGNALLATGDQANALSALKKAADLDSDDFELWRRILWLQYETSDYDGLLGTSERMIELYPNQPLGYYFTGIAYHEKKEHSKAVKPLKRAAMINVSDAPFSAQIHSLLGEVYHVMKEHDKSDSSYDKALGFDENNATVLNNYSYYLSLRSSNLDKAAEMAEKANQLVPNNASYQDTFGWVLYQKGDYAEAKEWLEKALKNGGENSVTVNDHYGDALYQLNNTEAAINAWQKALDLSDGKKKRISRKIAAKKIVD